LIAILAVSGCGKSNETVSNWQPPPGVAPALVLNQAQEDAREGRHADALAKHLWYHRNAVQIEPAQVGVRLSFALMYWAQLAQRYRPALDALKAERDAAEEAVRRGENVRDRFMEAQALNKTLGTDWATARLFRALDASRPEDARKVCRHAQRALVKAGEYALCGKYLQPEEETRRMLEEYEDSKVRAEASEGNIRLNHLRYGDESLRYYSSVLVALLVKNQREEEADRVMEKVLSRVDQPELRAALEKARSGGFPPEWP
jgi:hypothetical protein